MKIFYGVRTRIFDSLKVEVAKMTIEAEAQPENTFRETVGYDEYNDWFATAKDAHEFYCSALAD